MFDFCVNKIPGIKFTNVPKEDIEENAKNLKERFDSAKTLPGTQSYHRIVPCSQDTVKCYKLSGQNDEPDCVKITMGNKASEAEINVNSHIICFYDSSPWVGIVTEHSEEHGDFNVAFMHPNASKLSSNFHWPVNEDKCWVPRENIICTIDPPNLRSTTTISYGLSPKDQIKVAKLL